MGNTTPKAGRVLPRIWTIILCFVKTEPPRLSDTTHLNAQNGPCLTWRYCRVPLLVLTKMGGAARDPGGRSTEWKAPDMSLQTSFSTEFAPLPIPFVVAPKLDGDLLTMVIVGELDIATAHLLEEAQRSVQGRYRALRYELAGLGFMDSAGLRALLAPANGHVPISEISITQPTRAVRRLLEIRGMLGMIANDNEKGL